ncbi:MAG: divergent PAP2 family protein [Candidatus Dormibacteria bacterium]
MLLPMVSWIVAQTLKVIVDSVRRRHVDVRMFASAGGMPSSHTALVVALATTIGRNLGVQSPLFALALIFAFVVMYDAAGVRRAAGRQAAVLNRILDDLLVRGEGIREDRLREFIGHTPFQVLAGAALGLVTGLWPL